MVDHILQLGSAHLKLWQYRISLAHTLKNIPKVINRITAETTFHTIHCPHNMCLIYHCWQKWKVNCVYHSDSWRTDDELVEKYSLLGDHSKSIFLQMFPFLNPLPLPIHFLTIKMMCLLFAWPHPIWTNELFDWPLE